MTERDKKIIQLLKQFRVLSRTHLERLICPEVARPHVTVNRIVKRLARDGWILPIPQPKELPYLYMPNPALIHTQSAKLRHYLGLVDIYLILDKPEVYEIEPYFSADYRPDVRTIFMGRSVLLEYQRSIVSNKKMQEKVDGFVKTNKEGLHDAKSLLIITDYGYELKAPAGYEVIQRKMDIV